MEMGAKRLEAFTIAANEECRFARNDSAFSGVTADFSV
jgi:hypothetical protein